MLRSLYSGVSGLQNHQTRLDTIGNNIANVNTAGFKRDRVSFQEAFNQTLDPATAPDDDRGGTNPDQVGLGMNVGSIDTVHTQGSLETTDRPTDLAIEGDGFFIVNDGDRDLFTRVGNFGMDEDWNLVSQDTGNIVQGVGPGPDDDLDDVDLDDLDDINLEDFITNDASDIEDVDDMETFEIDTAGNITIIDTEGENHQVGQIAMSQFPNAGGLTKEGSGLYSDSQNSGEVDVGEPGTDGRGNIAVGALEMSNVDLSQEFTDMIITQRGFQANSRSVTTGDEVLQELVNLK